MSGRASRPMARVDVRSTPIDVPKQEVITKDNVTVNIDAVVYFKVINPARAVLETTNYVAATSQFAQAALRDVSGNANLDDLLSNATISPIRLNQLLTNRPNHGVLMSRWSSCRILSCRRI